MAPSQVSELLDLKFQNAQLKLQALQIQMQQIQANGQALVKERDEALAAMRAEVGAGPTDPYNPQTRTFTSSPKPLSTPPSRQAKRAAVQSRKD